MKLPIKDKKFLFLLFAIAIVVTLEILSIVGIDIPMPYAPFIYATFILIIGYNVLWNCVKAIFKLHFSNINLLMLIAVIGAFYLSEFPEAAVLVVLYVLGENTSNVFLIEPLKSNVRASPVVSAFVTS